MYPNNRPSRMWLIVPAAAIAVIIAVVVAAGLYIGNASGRPYYWFPFPFFPLVLIPVFVLIFFGFRFFFWGCWGRGYYYGQNYDPAIGTVRERYAKGEITREQLELMTRDLHN
jgi:uncharacterized membrane protein